MEKLSAVPGLLSAANAEIPLLEHELVLNPQGVSGRLEANRNFVLARGASASRGGESLDAGRAVELDRRIRELGEYIAGTVVDPPVLFLVCRRPNITLGELAVYMDGNLSACSKELDELVILGLVTVVQTEFGDGYRLSN